MVSAWLKYNLTALLNYVICHKWYHILHRSHTSEIEAGRCGIANFHRFFAKIKASGVESVTRAMLHGIITSTRITLDPGIVISRARGIQNHTTVSMFLSHFVTCHLSINSVCVFCRKISVNSTRSFENFRIFVQFALLSNLILSYNIAKIIILQQFYEILYYISLKYDWYNIRYLHNTQTS